MGRRRWTDSRAQGVGLGIAGRKRTAEYHDRRSAPSDAVVPVHLHEVDAVNDKDEPTKLWLATTLTEVEATGAAWGRLYRERWKGENDIRDVKKALKIDEMRGRAPDMVTKEWWLGLAAHNLTIQVRRIAAAAGNRQPRDLSFKGTLSLVAELLAPKDTAPEEYLRLFATTIAGALQRKLPKRPDRHHPRTVLARGQKYPKRHPKKLEERPRQ